MFYRAPFDRTPAPWDDEDDSSATNSYESQMRCPGVVISVPEACKMLRISRWTLYKLIHERQIGTIKIGARRLIPITAVYSLIDRLQGEEAA